MDQILIQLASKMDSVKRFVIVLLSGSYFCVAAAADAQVTFITPSDSITDFNQYDRIETCHALSKRMAKQLAAKLDSVGIKRQIFQSAPVDTTNDLLRWSVGECMRKFHISSVHHHDSVARTNTIMPTAIKLYYQGNFKDRFLLMIDSIMLGSQEVHDGYRGHYMAFSSIREAIGAVRPRDYDLIASLEDKYLMPEIIKAKDTGNIAAATEYYNIMLARVGHKYEDSIEASLPAYEEVIDSIQRFLSSHPGGDTSNETYSTRSTLRRVYDKINFATALDSLRRRGPDGYFDALRQSQRLAGFSENYELPNGQGYSWTPLAFLGFRYGHDTWYADSTRSTTKPENKEYPLMSKQTPQLIIFLSALCREEHKFLISWVRSSVQSRECWDRYEYIKWFHERYPDIPITIITSTTGNYDELATPDPYQEAELIKEAWWSFHKLPANIVIYHTDYFIMPEHDQRRQDIDNGNLRSYKEIPGISATLIELPLEAILVGSDGRIITTLSLGWGAVKRTKEIVDSYYTWYRNTLQSLSHE